jgi:catechol 2,3-dioxygenase
LGHVHMHVADLDQATSFYERVVGFDFLMNYVGTASFLSAGGYHHHVGLNTWNGVGAPPPPPDSVGLRYFTVLVHGEDQMAELKGRLIQAGSQFEEMDGGILTQDPSQNGILFSLA